MKTSACKMAMIVTASVTAMIFITPAFAQKNKNGNKGRGQGNHGRHVVDISPWGIGYGYQNRNFGISLGPYGSQIAESVIGNPAVGGFGFNDFNHGPVVVPIQVFDPWLQGGFGGSFPYRGPTPGFPTAEFATPSQAAFFNSAPAPAIVDGTTYTQNAVTAFANRDYEMALRYAMHARIDSPKDSWLIEFTAQCQFAIGDYLSAANSISELVSISGSSAWGRVIGNFRELYRSNDYPHQISSLEQFAGSHSESWAFSLLGYHYFYLGHIDEAGMMFNSARGLNPADPIALKMIPMIESRTTSPSELVQPIPALGRPVKEPESIPQLQPVLPPPREGEEIELPD